MERFDNLDDALKDCEAIVCLPVSGKTPLSPESLIKKCSMCDKEVWLSSSSQMLLNFKQLPLVCINCAILMTEAGEA